MRKRRRRKSSLSRKRAKLRREALGMLEEGSSFLPGVGLAKTTHSTARRTVRTVIAAKDYISELYKDTKHKVGRRNPFR